MCTYMYVIHEFLLSDNNTGIGMYYAGNGSNVYYLNNFRNLPRSYGESIIAAWTLRTVEPLNNRHFLSYVQRLEVMCISMVL